MPAGYGPWWEAGRALEGTSAAEPEEERDAKAALCVCHSGGTRLGGEPYGAKPSARARDEGTRLIRHPGFSAGKPGGTGYQRPLWLLSAAESGGRRVCRSIEQFQ